jgi:hypothetical protein
MGERSLGYNPGMDEPDLTRRRWFDLPSIAILVALTCVAGSVVGKWMESRNRDQYLGELSKRGVYFSSGVIVDEWSTEWPFHNVERVSSILLVDGRFADDDIRSLRQIFPGVRIYHRSLFLCACRRLGPNDLVKLPAD